MPPEGLFTRRLLHLSFYMPSAELRRVIEAAPCAVPWRVSAQVSAHVKEHAVRTEFTSWVAARELGR